jgi:hypothetical protein
VYGIRFEETNIEEELGIERKGISIGNNFKLWKILFNGSLF